MAAINKNLSFSKRKPDLLMDGGEVVEKRKKGRPRKDKMAAPITQPFTQVNKWREKMNIGPYDILFGVSRFFKSSIRFDFRIFFLLAQILD